MRGGAEGIRTPDPHTASVVRYQLRHGPAYPDRPGTGAIVHITPARVTSPFLVQGGIRREDRDRRRDAALAAEHHRPQVVGPVDEGVSGQRLEHEPRAALDLAFQLTRTPAGVPGEDPYGQHRLLEPVRVAG